MLLVSIINHAATSRAGRAINTSALVPPELTALLWDHHIECHPSTHRQLRSLFRVKMLLLRQSVGRAKKQDSEKHAPNGMEPTEKKRKKNHDGKDAPPDETTHGDNSQSKTQSPTDGISETSGDKKVKKRRKEKGEKSRLKQGDVSKETITLQEPVPPPVGDTTKDEKRVKKRKHKEKREEAAETNHGGTAVEAVTKLEPLASRPDDAKGERNERKGKDEKATGEKRKHEDSVANGVERKRRKRKEE